MVVRIAHPGTPTKLIDRGPASARVHRDWWAMRMTIEEQLALTARKGLRADYDRHATLLPSMSKAERYLS